MCNSRKTGIQIVRRQSSRNRITIRENFVKLRIQEDATLEDVSEILKLASDRIKYYNAKEDRPDVYRSDVKLRK